MLLTPAAARHIKLLMSLRHGVALKADIEEAEAAEDLWPCPPNEKRIERFKELLEYYEMDLEALREARKRRAKA